MRTTAHQGFLRSQVVLSEPAAFFSSLPDPSAVDRNSGLNHLQVTWTANGQLPLAYCGAPKAAFSTKGVGLATPFVSDQPETGVSGRSYSSMYHSSMECINTMPISSTRPLGTFLMRTEVLVG